MASVTQRIAEVKQPHGGYLPMKSFKKDIFNDDKILNESENIHASLIGMAVDYLTRFMLGDSVDEAFRISCMGAVRINMQSKADSLKANITGLDDISIVSACKLVGFDVCIRSSKSSYKPVENINPDESTIENIRIMVNRSISFWNKYGPIVRSELTFEGGYTSTVDSGDGDFLSEDTLWDFKVSKSAPTSKHSLQILMYYVMGIYSIHDCYRNISNLGFFNPRLNIAYICPVSSISKETIEEIENNVICYGVCKNTYQETTTSEKTIQKDIPEQWKQSDVSDDLTVAQLCMETGFKKSTVYADIRAGKLYAYKKGGKYYISRRDSWLYIESVRRQQNIIIGVSLVMVIAAVIYLIIFLVK